MLKLAIIEDDLDFREEMLSHFNHIPEIQCILAIDSVPKFLTFFRPFMGINAILLDINLPNLSGTDGLPSIRKLAPDAEIIMHTVVNDYDIIFKCICSGANGYLVKNGNLDQLSETLISIDNGTGCALSPSVARRILSYFQPESKKADKTENLSDQEILVSRFLVDGLSYQQIADKMNISINGVRYHVKNIYKKLHIKSRTALSRKYREGLFDWFD